MPPRKHSKRTEPNVTAGAVSAEELAAEFPRIDLPIHPPFPPMEAKQADAIPQGAHWQYEPKWDGFRCLAFRDGDTVVLQSKAGQPLGRYFPELVEAVRNLRQKRFVLDGEIVITKEGALAFDELLMRIHPAESRIRRLSVETPAQLFCFDLLADDGQDLTGQPLDLRRQRLERFFNDVPRDSRLHLSPKTTSYDTARGWVEDVGSAGLDGVIAKRRDLPYASGERSAMVKVKRIRTADCVVGGFRWASKGGQVGSLLLGLYGDDGLLHHVGFTSSFNAEQKKELEEILKPYLGGEGFSGNAPGGPSRWSTERSGEWERLQPKLVCEVRYDHFSGGRFRHGTKFLRWRPEKKPKACTFAQVERATGDGIIERLLAA